MPRDRRLQIAGGIYHVISRGIERRDIFLSNSDRQEFIARLEAGLEKTGAQCLAWALLNNHFHLLIRTGKESLSNLMRRLLTGYAIYFNRQHKRHGYLYQSRYKSILCQEDIYLQELVRYIHLNPLRASIVRTLRELDNYSWGGHSALLGKKTNKWQEINYVLYLFSDKFDEAIERYREFVRAGVNMGKREDLVGGGLLRSAGGWKGVRELSKNKQRWRGDERILGEGSFVEDVLKEFDERCERKERLKQEGWDIERLAKRICDSYGLKLDDLKRRGKGRRSEARCVLCYLGYKDLGVSGRELGQYLGISRSAVSQNIAQAEKYNPETMGILKY